MSSGNLIFYHVTLGVFFHRVRNLDGKPLKSFPLTPVVCSAIQLGQGIGVFNLPFSDSWHNDLLLVNKAYERKKRKEGSS